jgi:hypothetical protein
MEYTWSTLGVPFEYPWSTLGVLTRFMTSRSARSAAPTAFLRSRFSHDRICKSVRIAVRVCVCGRGCGRVRERECVWACVGIAHARTCSHARAHSRRHTHAASATLGLRAEACRPENAASNRRVPLEYPAEYSKFRAPAGQRTQQARRRRRASRRSRPGASPPPSAATFTMAHLLHRHWYIWCIAASTSSNVMYVHCGAKGFHVATPLKFATPYSQRYSAALRGTLGFSKVLTGSPRYHGLV